MKKPDTPVLAFLQRYRYQFLFIVVLAAAAFFRFYQLNHLPPGLHPDEAANGLDIFRILQQHDWRPIYNTNGSREALFFYLQAIFVATMGNTITALRMAPAIAGTLAVAVLYFWARRLWTQRVALISSFLFAVSPWAVTLSRDGFRASLTPLFVILTMWMYTLGYQTRQRKWFVLAGVSLGGGMYTYLSFKAFPLALIITYGAMWIWRRDIIKQFNRLILISLLAFAVTMLPMALFAVKHPGDVFSRVGGVSFLEPSLNHGKPLQTLVDTTVKTALMFNLQGDQNYRQNLGGYPELSFFAGIMFILGVLICFANIRRPKYLMVLALFAVMLLPEVLTAEGIPHALRAIGALPAVMILAALGTSYMLERWYLTFPINHAARTTGLAAILILLALTGYEGYNQYFVAWAQSPQTYQAYSEDAVAIAKYINNDGFSGQRYLVYDGYSDKTVQYLTHGKSNYTFIDPPAIKDLPQAGSKEFIIGEQELDAALQNLRQRFPKGRLTRQFSDFNQAELFEVYEVKQ